MVTSSRTCSLKPKIFVTIILPKPSYYVETHGISEWEETIEEEFQALIANGTWKLVPYPKDVDPIGSKWVYCIKLKVDVVLDKYKARVVAKDYDKFEGIVYI